MELLGHYNYWVVIVLMMTGFYVVIARGNLIKKIIGLNIFQTSVFLFYISMGKISGGTPPILEAYVARAGMAWLREIGLEAIGAWTAHYIAMRAGGEPDAFPATDLGLLRAATRLGIADNAKELTARAETWRPWRAYAAMHLWRSEADAPDARRGAARIKGEKVDVLHAYG